MLRSNVTEGSEAGLHSFIQFLTSHSAASAQHPRPSIPSARLHGASSPKRGQRNRKRCFLFASTLAKTRLLWSFPDPSAFQGGHDEKLARTREIRDTIKAKAPKSAPP